VNDGRPLAAAGVALAMLLALGPPPELTFVLGWFGAGSVVGTLVAYRARKRKSGARRARAAGALGVGRPCLWRSP
jgi:multisubunit Na+/H+ antiporter MnhB subunit